MVRLLLSAALLATFAAPALGHMGMTIVKGGVKFPRDKAKGDAYRYPNYPMCHGVAKGASKITFNVNEAVQGRTSSGAGHNGGHCAWALSEDGKTFYKFNDKVDCTATSAAGQAHDFKVPENAPISCATGCVLGWFWTPASSGACEVYQNCWDITITGAKGGLKDKAFKIATPKTTPAGGCKRVNKQKLTAMYGPVATDAITTIVPDVVDVGAGGTVVIAPPDSVGTKPEDKPGCVTYTAVQGDSLSKIATRFDVEAVDPPTKLNPATGGGTIWEKIFALNKNTMTDADTLNVGQKLLMPGDCDPAKAVTAGGPATAAAASVPLLAAAALAAALVR